jgi:hypothetical protein
VRQLSARSITRGGALFYTWRSSKNSSAQAQTGASTVALYDETERERKFKEV